jgi:PAS domain-containing protein
VREKLERSLADSPLPQLVVGADGVLGAASPKAIDLLGLPGDAPGQPFETVAHKASGDGLSQLVRDACERNEPLTFAAQPWSGPGGAERLLSGGIVPVRDDKGALLGAAVTLDVTDSATDELQMHNDALSRDNTELRSIADELRVRTDELNVVAVFLQSVLTSLRGAVVVVDPRMFVRVWNTEAERLWGVQRAVAMSSRLTELDLGFDIDQLLAHINAGFAGEVRDDVELAIRGQGGERRRYTVTVTPLLGPTASVHGVTLLFIERKPP